MPLQAVQCFVYMQHLLNPAQMIYCCCVYWWKQVCEGEKITGTLSCKPNEKNPRDLDITLEYHFEGKHCEAHRTQEYRMR